MVTFQDLQELPSRFAGRTFKQISLVHFLTQDDEEVAQVEAWGVRTERGTAKGKGKYRYLQPQKYTANDLTNIADEYATETCRAAKPLYWDDLEIGQQTPSIVRDPYTTTIAVAFEQAWGGLFTRSHGFWFDLVSRHPALWLQNEHGVPEPPEAVHWDSALARSAGVPTAYDYGPELISWMATMLSNWCGDQGRLVGLNCEIGRFNLWAICQRGERTVKGNGQVVLPRRP